MLSSVANTSQETITTSILNLRTTGMSLSTFKWNVVVHIQILVKKSVAITKNVCASRQVKEKEEGRGDSKGRKSYGINQC